MRRASAAAVGSLWAVLAVFVPPTAADPVTPRGRAGPAVLSASVYWPPVDAEVLDPFRPPPFPWLAGNRGIEYATSPGTPVRVIGPGVVTFAGGVAGQVWVTVLHGDGLRSSYGVAAAWVRRGQRLRSGALVGVASDTLHLGVRWGSAYLDPESLWGRRVGPGRVALVPLRPDRASALGRRIPPG